MIKNGVTLRRDARDKLWSYHHNNLRYGVIAPPLPKTLGRRLEPSYNQYATYLCTAYATAMAGQYRRRMAMSPEWQSGKVSEISGDSIAHVGADPRDAMKAACVWGHTPQTMVPFTLDEKGEDYVADWTHYTKEQDAIALTYVEKGYKPIIPLKGQDQFDAIRQAMWQEFCIHGDNASPVLCASEWYSNFNIEERVTTAFIRTGAHMYCAVDFDTIDGIDYLRIQSSSGDSSLKWFSRDVINTLYQNPAAFAGIFSEDDRYREGFLLEALKKLLCALQNYVFQITK